MLQGADAWAETGSDLFLPWQGLEEKTVAMILMMMVMKKLSMIMMIMRIELMVILSTWCSDDYPDH